jgi:23S rRNA U2552 (ribose-2'-O)-methylase RlmE/FtsJ
MNEIIIKPIIIKVKCDDIIKDNSEQYDIVLSEGMPKPNDIFGNYNLLYSEKSKIDIYKNIFYKFRNVTNDFEFVGTGRNSIVSTNVISRAYFKLWEILKNFNLIDLESKNFTFAGLAEGPGGFLQCVRDYRLKYFIPIKKKTNSVDYKSNPIIFNKLNDNFYGITLRNSGCPNWSDKLRNDYYSDKFNYKYYPEKFNGGYHSEKFNNGYHSEKFLKSDIENYGTYEQNDKYENNDKNGTYEQNDKYGTYGTYEQNDKYGTYGTYEQNDKYGTYGTYGTYEQNDKYGTYRTYGTYEQNDKYENISKYGNFGPYEQKRKKNHTKMYNQDNYYGRSIIKINYGSEKFNDGDLLNPENILSFNNYVPVPADFVTADGGIGVDNEDGIITETYKEQVHLHLFYAEIITTLILLKKGSNFVIKIYDIFTLPTAQLITILAMNFDSVYIVKPQTSRPANSEKYMVCIGYKQQNQYKIHKMYSCLKSVYQKTTKLPSKNNDLYIHSFGSIPVSKDIIESINKANNIFCELQIETIKRTIKLIKLSECGRDKLRKEKKRRLCTQTICAKKWCDNYNIDYY